MGMIRAIMGAMFLRGGAERLGRVGVDLASTFRPHATRRMELGHEAFAATQAAYAAEFNHAPQGWFDRFINGLNRLPRPVLALATPGLFAYAMVDPEGFSQRMQGLALVPEPLWWLMGAVVAFYFGARETHYLREHRPSAGPTGGAAPPAPAAPSAAARGNPALADWLDGHEGQ